MHYRLLALYSLFSYAPQNVESRAKKCTLCSILCRYEYECPHNAQSSTYQNVSLLGIMPLLMCSEYACRFHTMFLNEYPFRSDIICILQCVDSARRDEEELGHVLRV